MADPEIQPKAEWLPADCLFCRRDATLMAVWVQGSTSATIRCCDASTCQQAAKKMALEQGRMLAGKAAEFSEVG